MLAPAPRKNGSLVKGDPLNIALRYKAGSPSAYVDLSDYTCEIGLSWGDGCDNQTLVETLVSDANGWIIGSVATTDMPAGGRVTYAVRITSPDLVPKTILTGYFDVEFSPLS